MSSFSRTCQYVAVTVLLASELGSQPKHDHRINHVIRDAAVDRRAGRGVARGRVRGAPARAAPGGAAPLACSPCCRLIERALLRSRSAL